MTTRAKRLLAIPVPRIFRSGACHVFTACLVRTSGYRLLSVREDGGDFFHLACAPEEDVVLDAFGWFSRSEYIHTDFLEGKKLRFELTTEEEVRRRYTEEDGPGLYSHPSFIAPCTLLAEEWIQRHKAHFDRSVREPIPEISSILSG